MWWDWMFIAMAVSSSLYLLFTWRGRSGAYIPSLDEVVFGLIMIIAILEATRRYVGWALSITSIIFLAYALFGSNLPGLLAHKPYSLKRLASFLFTTTSRAVSFEPLWRWTFRNFGAPEPWSL